jgi:hypothetical protein
MGLGFVVSSLASVESLTLLRTTLGRSALAAVLGNAAHTTSQERREGLMVVMDMGRLPEDPGLNLN